MLRSISFLTAAAVVLCSASSIRVVIGQSNRTTSVGEQEIAKIESELATAFLKGDAGVCRRVMADDWVGVDDEGMLFDKATLVKDLVSGDLKITTGKKDDLKVRIYGDTAIAIYRLTQNMTYKGHDASGAYRSTDIFVKRDGQWQMVGWHTSKMP